MDHPLAEQAAKILRRHSINAYEQEGDIVLYVVDSSNYEEVFRLSIATKFDVPEQIAQALVNWIATNIRGPHTHD